MQFFIFSVEFAFLDLSPSPPPPIHLNSLINFESALVVFFLRLKPFTGTGLALLLFPNASES